MKTEWICKWQMIPGEGEQTAVYSPQSETREQYGTKIDRKTVARHLELLETFHYNIQKCDGGCYIGK